MSEEEVTQLIQLEQSRGWICDRNDEKVVGFIWKENGESRWFGDYYKDTRRFVQGDATWEINLVNNGSGKKDE